MVRRRYKQGVLVLGLGLTAAPAFAQGKAVSFGKDVLPIFQKKCANCHGAGNSAGLKVDTYDALMQGGTKGQVVVPGNPDQSKLFTMVATRKMPPSGQKLTPMEVSQVRAWILAGAKGEEAVVTGAEKPLAIAEPRDGAQVKERVRISVPMNTIPTDGFVAIYIDGRFKLALAPPSPEEIAEKKMKPDSPVSYHWDTKSLLAEDRTLTADDRVVKDGPHLIEVRSYNASGEEAERARVQVNVKNAVDVPANKPLRLWYNSGPIGKQFLMEHTVDLTATAGQSGLAGGGLAGGGLGGAEAPAAGGDRITHLETSKYLVSLEDLTNATRVGFWRERRESPLTITVNGTKQIVRSDATSRYYSMTPRGQVVRSKAMERESRVPIINPIDLPGRSHRASDPFTTNLRIHLGAYIPGALNVERVDATIQGMEWQHGEECAKIVLTYAAGNSKLNINSVNIRDAAFEIQQGTTTVWFSERTNRVIKSETELTGNLVVDLSSGGGAGPGGGGYPGGAPGGLPGGELGGGYPGGGFGAPFGGGGYPGGAPGGFPGGAPGGGYPGIPGGGGGYPGGAPGGAPGGYPGGAPGGFPGGAPGGGYPGMPGGGGGYPGGGPGGFPGAMPGGGNTGIAPTNKRYFVRLKVKSQLVDEEQPKVAAR